MFTDEQKAELAAPLNGIKPPSRNPVPGSKNTRFKKKWRRETGRFERWDRVKQDWCSRGAA